MSNPKCDLYANLLESAIADTVKVAADVRQEDRLRNLKEHKAHPHWLVGHLANTLDRVILMWVLDQPSLLPPGYGRTFAPDFAGGNPITTNAADYPAWDEVLENYQRVGARVVELVKAFDDRDLPLPLKGPIPDALRDFFTTNQATLARIIGHDSYHRGQIGLLSKLNA